MNATTSRIPAALQNLALPVISSPMFTVSYPELVLAQCKAGIVGSFPALNARQPELLDEWLHQMKADLDAYRAANPGQPVGPIAVNQIAHSSNVRLMQDAKSSMPCTVTAASYSTTWSMCAMPRRRWRRGWTA